MRPGERIVIRREPEMRPLICASTVDTTVKIRYNRHILREQGRPLLPLGI